MFFVRRVVSISSRTRVTLWYVERARINRPMDVRQTHVVQITMCFILGANEGICSRSLWRTFKCNMDTGDVRYIFEGMNVLFTFT